MFRFLKKLKLRSGYSYTTAAGRRARKLGEASARSVQSIFADGVEFGRSLEREAKHDVKRVVKRRR